MTNPHNNYEAMHAAAEELQDLLDGLFNSLDHDGDPNQPAIAHGNRLSYGTDGVHNMLSLQGDEDTLGDMKAAAGVIEALNALSAIHDLIHAALFFTDHVCHGENHKAMPGWADVHDTTTRSSNFSHNDEGDIRIINMLTDFDSLHIYRDIVVDIEQALSELAELEIISQTTFVDEKTLTYLEADTIKQAANTISNAVADINKHLHPVVSGSYDYFELFETPDPSMTLGKIAHTGAKIFNRVEYRLNRAHDSLDVVLQDKNITAVISVMATLLRDAYVKDGVDEALKFFDGDDD